MFWRNKTGRGWLKPATSCRSNASQLWDLLLGNAHSWSSSVSPFDNSLTFTVSTSDGESTFTRNPKHWVCYPAHCPSRDIEGKPGKWINQQQNHPPTHDTVTAESAHPGHASEDAWLTALPPTLFTFQQPPQPSPAELGSCFGLGEWPRHEPPAAFHKQDATSTNPYCMQMKTLYIPLQ